MDNRDSETREVRSESNGRDKNGKSFQTKNKLNIVCRGYVKTNKAGGEIISVVPDIPISAYLDDLLFILTVPNQDQTYAPAYIRLQDKDHFNYKGSDGEELKEFTTDIRVTGYLKQKRGEIIVCAPKTHVKVDLNKIVFIATIPAEDKDRAPCYIKPKNFKFEGRNRDIPQHDDKDDVIVESEEGADIDIDKIELLDGESDN